MPANGGNPNILYTDFPGIPPSEWPNPGERIKIEHVSDTVRNVWFFVKYEPGSTPSGSNPWPKWNREDWAAERGGASPNALYTCVPVWKGTGPEPASKPTCVVQKAKNGDRVPGPDWMQPYNVGTGGQDWRQNVLTPPLPQTLGPQRPSTQNFKYRVVQEKYSDNYVGSQAVGNKAWIRSGVEREEWGPSPWDLGWIKGKDILKEFQDRYSPSSSSSTDVGTVSVSRPAGNIIFNPPFLNHSLPIPGVKYPGEARPDWIPGFKRGDVSRLLTITPPDYIQSLTADERNKYYKYPWGFRALMNPTTWGYEATVQEALTISQAITSQTEPLIPGTFNYVIQFMIFRGMDLDLISRTRENLTRKLKRPPTNSELTSLLTEDDYSAGMWRVDETVLKANPDIVGAYASLHPLLELERWGTEYDIDFLYRVINGDPINEFPSITNNKWTANRSFMTANRVRVRLGMAEVFEGRITGINVNHLMMTTQMVPTVSEVQLSIQRWPGYDIGTNRASGKNPKKKRPKKNTSSGGGSGNASNAGNGRPLYSSNQAGGGL